MFLAAARGCGSAFGVRSCSVILKVSLLLPWFLGQREVQMIVDMIRWIALLLPIIVSTSMARRLKALHLLDPYTIYLFEGSIILTSLYKIRKMQGMGGVRFGGLGFGVWSLGL